MTRIRRLRRADLALAAVLGPTGVLAIVAMLVLWPGGSPVVRSEVAAAGATYPSARVVESVMRSCTATSEDRLIDGTIPEAVECLRVTATVTSGARSGEEVEVWATPRLRPADVPAGTRITLQHYPGASGDAEVWAWHDFARTIPLALLLASFVLVTLAVARSRGMRALVGLALAFAVIAVFMIPALLDGESGLLVGLSGSTVIMFVVLYLAHGFNRRTSTALVGTLVGLALTAGLGALGAGAARLTGITSEDDFLLSTLLGESSSAGLRGIFLCGVVLAGLGVLNDVTITQASAVWELHESAPATARRELFRRGMRIGRDHIASTVYTIAFAYAGASLPVLLLLEIYQMPVIQTVTSGAFAGEIVRTLAGSVGLVLAIPLTTAIAALVVAADPDRPVPRHRRRLSEPHPVH